LLAPQEPTDAALRQPHFPFGGGKVHVVSGWLLSKLAFVSVVVVFWLLEFGAPCVVVVVQVISLCSLTQLLGSGAAPDDAGTVRPTATAATARTPARRLLFILLLSAEPARVAQ